MKLTIPYKYEETTIPYRCRKPRLVEFDAEITLTVKEPDADEFPVVGVLHGHKWTDTRIETSVELRKLGRYFYSNRQCPYDSVHDEGIGIDELGRKIAFWSSHNCYDTRFLCGKQEARKRLMATAREFVVFEGEVWSRCGEPMYLVQTFGLGHNHGGTALFVEGHYNPNINKSRYRNANDLNGAVALFFRTAEGRGDTDDAERMAKHIKNGTFREWNDYVEVLDPSAFTANPKRDGYDGDPFLNGIESMVQKTESSSEAGVLLLAMAMAETA